MKAGSTCKLSIYRSYEVFLYNPNTPIRLTNAKQRKTCKRID